MSSTRPSRASRASRPSRSLHRQLSALALLTASAVASAHVTLPPGGASAGSDYEAAFRVGHACEGSQATSAIAVRLPKGFALAEARPRPGWKLETLKTGEGEVRWTADSAASALPTAERAEFILRGKLPSSPGPLFFKVLQTCNKGSALVSSDWSQTPTGVPGDKLAFPAARLDVLPPGVAAVDVKDAWIRQTVPGQSGTGAFMKLSAPSGARLVGASTPAAGVAEVHEMKLEDGVMRMREVKGGLALPPREQVELKPSGYHVMLMDLKQTMTQGSSVPLTLRFEDAKGAKSSLQLNVPVGAPVGAAAGAAHMH